MMMEQTDEDWDAISDAELLQIPLDDFSTDKSSQPHSSQSGKSQDMHNRTPITSKSIHSYVPPPLRFFKRHLSVSLLCEQTWCEMKVQYGFLKPQIRKQEKKRTEVQTGASIHLARELEVHDVVSVDVETPDDLVAVSLVNMLHMIHTLEAGKCVREFPVLGEVEGVFVKGVIDELSYNQKGELVLKELKTRRTASLPGSSQAVSHSLQVSLYKLLFDKLVRGEVKKEHILQHLNLSASRTLGAAVRTQAAKVGVTTVTVGELVDALLLTLACSDLPCVDVLQLEYQHQSSSAIIGTVTPPFDETTLRKEVSVYLEYWTRQREARGVDIEEAWKCLSCPYGEICEWRTNQADVLQSEQQ
ncbi:exonuclease V [Trichomycterus rosablanca]|uniref:exonuclease V n=1 Tax=Trichomycterus rosablanca TaxID=2290929 RepID=UPI002F35B6C8